MKTKRMTAAQVTAIAEAADLLYRDGHGFNAIGEMLQVDQHKAFTYWQRRGFRGDKAIVESREVSNVDYGAYLRGETVLFATSV